MKQLNNTKYVKRVLLASATAAVAIMGTTAYAQPAHLGGSRYPLMLLTVLIIAAGVVFYLVNRLIRSRVESASQQAIDLNDMMTQALAMGDYYVLEYNLESRRLTNLYGNFLPPGGFTTEEFISHLAEDDQEQVGRYFNDQSLLESDHYDIVHAWNIGTKELPQWKHYKTGATTERNTNGTLKSIIISLNDITKSVNEERVTHDLTGKYHKMFDSSLVAMSFYSKDGWLIDLNDKMRELCQFDEAGEKYFRQKNLFDVPMLNGDFHAGLREAFYVCQHMSYPEAGIDKYVEFRISPVLDEQGEELLYYSFTARDVTDERTLYLQLREQGRQIEQFNDICSSYESELRYLLENSNMFVWRMSLETKLLEFSRSLQNIEYSETVEEYFMSINEQHRAQAIATFSNKENLLKPFNVIHLFDKTPNNDKPSWYAISGMPTFDDKGVQTGLFGIVRDVTELMQVQEKLKKETMRADSSGRLKSTFLANMTHEIRTPLNAIVGFSELLQTIDDSNEKHDILRIIRNNCDMLLRLINDILEASTIDSNPIAINPSDIDFAQVFDDICQTLEQRVQEPGVAFIKENPYSTFATQLDKGRMQQVITNFVTNAVKYTHEGHIKVGYRYEKGGIYMYCEDTGAGIPKEKQASVFERFVKLNDYVQGTGLGLSICKAIAQRCHGRIGVESEGEGHGSTFWLWVPCVVKEAQKA